MQRKNWIFIVIIICFTSQIIYAQLQQFQFMYDDTMRTYVVYMPLLNPNPDGYPLIIGLHGTSANAYNFIANAELIQKAIEEQFIVACPNALHHPNFTFFNAGGGYEQLTDSTDDLGFISAVIDTMIKNYQIDTTRIYVMGHSNGAMMAYRIAAELSHKIAAIGANSGQMVYEYCNPEFPVPIIHMHGLSDSLCPYGGRGDSILAIPPVDSVMAIWRTINGCSSIHDTIYNQPGIIGKRWASASGFSDIQLYTIQNGGHQWPREDSLGISATLVFWDFLELQNNIVTNLKKQDTHSISTDFNLYQNYPNPFNPTTTIQYSMGNKQFVLLRVYDLMGGEIAVLVNEEESAGEHTVEFDGGSLPSGVYFYRLQAGDFIETKKMILMR